MKKSRKVRRDCGALVDLNELTYDDNCVEATKIKKKPAPNTSNTGAPSLLAPKKKANKQREYTVVVTTIDSRDGIIGEEEFNFDTFEEAKAYNDQLHNRWSYSWVRHNGPDL